MNTQKYQLKNGLTVILAPMQKSPVVSVQAWVRTGSADEQKGEEGISHFIEHLVFKGTQKFRTGEIAEIVEGAGGELNAYTSFDQTVFYVTISKSFSNIALETISQMMGFPQFDPQEIDNEREVVVEEIKRGLDSPSRQASQLFFTTMYPKHPYGVPVIGFEKNIRTWSAKKIRSYFESRYSPKNMFLVVSGDFNSKDMKSEVQKYFGPIPGHVVRKSQNVKLPVPKKAKQNAIKTDLNETYLYIAFGAPSAAHKDAPALDVVAHALGQGESSRLVNRLRMENSLVNSVGASSWTPQQEGAFIVSATLSETQLEAVLEIIAEELVQLIRDGITHKELYRAVTAVTAEEVYGLETVDGLSRKIGSAEFYYKTPNALDLHLQKIQKLTQKEIHQVIKKYFSPEKLTTVITSKLPEEKTQQIIKAFHQNILTQLGPNKKRLQVGTKKQSSAKQVTEKLLLKNGVKVYLRNIPGAQSMTIRTASLGGARALNEEVQGLTEIMSRVWTSSTTSRNEEQIVRICDETATAVSAYAGRNTFGLNMECLTQFDDQALGLLSDMILHPTFEAKYFDREKSIILNQIKSREDHPSSVMGRLFFQTLFAGHPYSFDTLGTEETVEKIRPKHCLEYLDKQLTAQNFHICIVGDFHRTKVLKWVEGLDSNLRKSSVAQPVFPLKVRQSNEFVYKKMNKEQSHMMIGFYGLTLDAVERDAFDIMDAVLSGMGGRLFQELREKKSLAYSVATQKFFGVETGFFGSYIGCSPEKAEIALKMMLEEFQKLMDTPVGEDELNRAIQGVIGSHDIDLQKKSSIANTILFDEIYGQDSTLSFDAERRYRGITSAQVQSVAKKILTQKYVCALVGPQPL